MMKKQYLLLLVLAASLITFSGCAKKAGHKALIITGQNNHNWKASSPVLKILLDQTGLFTSEIITTPDKGGDMSSFTPDFSEYDVIVLDYNGDPWPETTKASFEEYVKSGGGLVIYHAANNSFPEWKEYNLMIGLGGWGNRTEKDGPYVYYRGNQLVVDTTAGPGGSHAKRSEFEVRTRITDHPITLGLPVRWKHGNDELYSRLRGPAQNMDILATAHADTAGGGTGRDEPMLMVLSYGKGRIFHTALGHADEGGGPAMQCVGFITTFQRGAEWAATGSVTQPVPFDFPNAAGVVTRPDFKEITLEDDMAFIESYDITKSTKYYTDLQSHIRSASGDRGKLLKYEKLMVNVLKSKVATVDAKKLMLKELSWMGTDYCLPAIKELAENPELKDEAEFALARLQQ
jgi:type 1 glutamine amidotransferase